MRHADFPYLLYLVISTEACLGRDPVAVTEEAIKGGVDVVQLREKELPYGAFLDLALRMKEKLSKWNVPLIVNDNLEVAVACGAHGLHVGNHDLPPTDVRLRWPSCGLLGYSIEYLQQLSTAQAETSDYFGVSPVFSTPTKTDTVTEWGLEGLQKIRTLTSKPLVAIGRIDATNALEVIRAGADTLAVVSAICSSPDPQKAAFEIRNQIENR